MKKTIGLSGILAMMFLSGACGSTVEEVGGDQPSPPGVDADVAPTGQSHTVEAYNVGCGRNENLGRVVASGSVDNPFTDEGEERLEINIEIYAAGELLETVIVDETVYTYGSDSDLDLPENWEAISTKTVEEDSGPYECRVTSASMTRVSS